MKDWSCHWNKTVAHCDLESHLVVVYIMLHEIHKKRLQTKMKRQKQQLHLSALTKWQMVIVAMLICTFKANKHCCTYGEKIYALTCDRMRKEMSLFWALLSLCLALSLRAWQKRSWVLVGCGGKQGVNADSWLPPISAEIIIHAINKSV